MFIYTLIDPRDKSIRYVGATQNPKKRLWEHINDKRKKCHRVDWVQSLLRQGVSPEMDIIEEIPDDDWESRERYWIKTMRDSGYDLTNSTDGGDGIPFMSDEIKKKISDSRKGRFAGEDHPNFGVHWSEETRQKIGKANTGKKRTEEQRRKISESQRGKVVSDYTKEILRVASLGRKLSDDARNKIRESKIGKSQSPESNAKRSASLMGEKNHFFGKHHTDETKLKIKESKIGEKNPNYGKKMSDETKQKIRESKVGKKRPPDVIEKIRQGTIRAMQRLAEIKRQEQGGK